MITRAMIDGARERTPVGATPITLNPKVDGDATVLRCPECGEEIQCWSAPKRDLFEYHCGCEELRKFKIRRAPDD